MTKDQSKKQSNPKPHKKDSKKNGSDMLKFIKQKSIGAIDWIRSKDDYGAPINLTYEGEDSFKTLPGGIISLLFYFIFAFYCLISGLEMKNSQNWSLT